jgi:hypothetical protein
VKKLLNVTKIVFGRKLQLNFLRLAGLALAVAFALLHLTIALYGPFPQYSCEASTSRPRFQLQDSCTEATCPDSAGAIVRKIANLPYQQMLTFQACSHSNQRVHEQNSVTDLGSAKAKLLVVILSLFIQM